MNIQHKDWYKLSNEHIKKLYFRDSDLFISLLASTSPRKGVKANWNLAHKIYVNVISGFNPTDNIKGIMNAHKNNIKRSLKNTPLSGLKVENFRLALMGDLNAVVIDTWILKYFKFTKS